MESGRRNTYNTGCIKKGNRNWHVIVRYILRLTIYFFHANKDQAFSCRIIPGQDQGPYSS